MRGFTKAGLVVMVLGASLAGAAPGGAAEAARTTYAGGYSALEIGNASAGLVKSVGGGAAFADLRTTAMPTGGYPKKQLGPVKYQDITVVAGVGMKPAFYEWLRDTLRSPAVPPRKDGAVVGYDYQYKPVARTTFRGAFISAVEFPALDAASKDPAYMTVTLSPQSTARAPVVTTATATGPTLGSPKWMVANFRLRIDGVEAAAARARKIDPIGVRFKVVADATGDFRDYMRSPGAVDVSNLVVELTEADAAPFYKWHEEFVLKGANTDDKERKGALDMLGPTLQNLFTLTFSNVGIISIVPSSAPLGTETIRTVRVTMYVEGIGFDYSAGAAQ